MSGFRFHVGNRGGVKVVVFDDGGCRPASDAEVEMWDALVALRAENERLTTERDDARDLAKAHYAMLEDARAELEKLRAVAEAALDKLVLTLRSLASITKADTRLRLNEIRDALAATLSTGR